MGAVGGVGHINEKRRPPCGAAPGEALRRSVCSSAGRRLAGALGKASEGLAVADGDVGQHLAVQLEAGLLDPVHEARVGQAVLAGGGIDARDPQPAEVPLAVAAVAVRVLVRLEQGLLGPLVARMGLAPVALRARERGPALLARVDGALDPGHLETFPPSSLRTVSRSWSEIHAGLRWCRFRLGDFFSRMWVENACRPRSLPVAVLRKRFLAPECVFILGIATAQ